MKKLSVINKQLIEAAQNNRPGELKNLLSQGADIHADDDNALRWSALKGHLKVFKYLISQGAHVYAKNDEALRSSALNGHLEIVELLIAKGANIHANDDEPLRWATRYSHFEVVKFLISLGANIHVNDDEILKTATKNKNEPMLMLLNAFLTEEKLLVAALGSTSASSCFRGMPVLPSASTWVCGMLQTPQIKLKKSLRSKI